MSGILPTGKLPPSRVDPKVFLFYAMPKIGKTKLATELDNCLILDLEGGAEPYECARVPINSVTNIDQVIKEILDIGKNNGGKYPYDFIVLDTISKLEDLVEINETVKYKNSVMGKTFTGDFVTELPHGLGYGFVRRGVMDVIERLSRVCKHLILVGHVKEKVLSKGGVDVSYRDLALSGKLASIVPAAVDAVGYLYRAPETGSTIMISFKTGDGATMGSRIDHLKGQEFPFEWNKIYTHLNKQ
jgi:hypothetical protein